jgi:acetyl-CoA carboxylase carboxyl transferase subunit beta
VAQETPLIVVPASGGARMQEGILSLMQMARTTVAIERVKEKGLPYIVLLTDPTTGGVTASFAMLADIALAESGAVIGFAGVRVIEKTIRQSLPDGFQRAEYLKDKGIVDIVVDRPNLSATLGNVLSLLMHQAPPAEVVAMPMDDAPADAVDAENAPPEAETDMDPVSETEQATTVATPDDTAAGAPESEVAAETKDKTE